MFDSNFFYYSSSVFPSHLQRRHICLQVYNRHRVMCVNLLCDLTRGKNALREDTSLRVYTYLLLREDWSCVISTSFS